MILSSGRGLGSSNFSVPRVYYSLLRGLVECLYGCLYYLLGRLIRHLLYHSFLACCRHYGLLLCNQVLGRLSVSTGSVHVLYSSYLFRSIYRNIYFVCGFLGNSLRAYSFDIYVYGFLVLGRCLVLFSGSRVSSSSSF